MISFTSFLVLLCFCHGFCLVFFLLDATVEMQKDQRKWERKKRYLCYTYIVASNCRTSNDAALI